MKLKTVSNFFVCILAQIAHPHILGLGGATVFIFGYIVYILVYLFAYIVKISLNIRKKLEGDE